MGDGSPFFGRCDPWVFLPVPSDVALKSEVVLAHQRSHGDRGEGERTEGRLSLSGSGERKHLSMP